MAEVSAFCRTGRREQQQDFVIAAQKILDLPNYQQMMLGWIKFLVARPFSEASSYRPSAFYFRRCFRWR